MQHPVVWEIVPGEGKVEKKQSESAKSVSDYMMARTLTDREFKQISNMMYEKCRLNLHMGKRELVQARLNKRLRQLGMQSYGQYIKYVESDSTGAEATHMVDLLTTNMTYFFREPEHFRYLVENVFKHLTPATTAKLRIWSAGCSSGEEPYTIGMLMREYIQGLDRMDALVLGTDISMRVLAAARHGEYTEETFRNTPKMLRSKYFDMVSSPRETPKMYRVKPMVKKLIRFNHLNLMDSPWPMSGKFDVIFCRNVMIYFDKKTQEELLRRYYEVLNSGGLLMVGHSESLSGIKHGFDYVNPMTYRKP